MRIEQPTFPLTRDAFGAALQRGHGRARQQIDSYGSNGLEDKIIEACVSCLSYDPQCEEDRAPWLFSIVDRANLNAQVTQAIKVTIQEPPLENHRDMTQRSAILKELAAAGSDEARHMLYSSLVRLSHTSDVVGAEQIVALDGLDGLIRVARQLGRWLQADPDFWVDDYHIKQLDAAMGVEGGFAALESEAAVDPDVASYLAGMRETRESQIRNTRRCDATAYSGDQIVAHVNKNPKDQCSWFRQWGAQATSDQRETVFAALLVSDKPEHVQRLFRCFLKTGVPRFDMGLLRWLSHPDEQVRWAAVRSLAPIKDIKLRQAAMQLIADGDIANGVALLVNNFEAGDFAFCEKHLGQFNNADEAHHLVGALLDLCEAQPGADALDCLLYVYALSPCSICRKRAVKALTDMNIAPDWVLQECKLDADPDTQALVLTKTGHPGG